jgi:hypothetical protein
VQLRNRLRSWQQPQIIGASVEGEYRFAASFQAEGVGEANLTPPAESLSPVIGGIRGRLTTASSAKLAVRQIANPDIFELHIALPTSV